MAEVEGVASSAPLLLLGWLSSADSVSMAPASPPPSALWLVLGALSVSGVDPDDGGTCRRRSRRSRTAAARSSMVRAWWSRTPDELGP